MKSSLNVIEMSLKLLILELLFNTETEALYALSHDDNKLRIKSSTLDYLRFVALFSSLHLHHKLLWVLFCFFNRRERIRIFLRSSSDSWIGLFKLCCDGRKIYLIRELTFYKYKHVIFKLFVNSWNSHNIEEWSWEKKLFSFIFAIRKIAFWFCSLRLLCVVVTLRREKKWDYKYKKTEKRTS